MKLVTFIENEEMKLGVKLDRGVLAIEEALKFIPSTHSIPTTIDEIIGDSKTILDGLENYIDQVMQSDEIRCFYNEEELQLGPCVPNPGKIICVGLNYAKHAKESNAPIPETPILFSKFTNTIAASGDVILLPHSSTQVDYEAELGIVIGKQAKRVSKEAALDYVFGYCNVNDLSARDLQFKTHQWLLGKSCDGFCPVGPYLVSADEIRNPNDLGIRCYVNGEVRQDSNTSDMIFNCAEIISYISQHMTLCPGDLILTGTPAGVVFGYPEEQRVWLKDGDEVTIEIDGLGRLSNRMKHEW